MSEEIQIDSEIRDAEAREAAAKLADYEHGWSSDIEQEFAPKGLSEDTVRFISAKKEEPEWMLEWRLKAYRHWLTMEAPNWAKLNIPPIGIVEIRQDDDREPVINEPREISTAPCGPPSR